MTKQYKAQIVPSSLIIDFLTKKYPDELNKVFNKYCKKIGLDEVEELDEQQPMAFQNNAFDYAIHEHLYKNKQTDRYRKLHFH